MEKHLLELNQAQKDAVLAKDGPVMIIAGAGSGKTRVLTHRIAYMMDSGIDAFNILSLTFTNKAAREMRHRIEELLGSEARNLWMGTFHSVFARILRFEADALGYPSNFTIYDTQDALQLITRITSDLNLDKTFYKPKQVLGRISQYKSNLISPEQYINSSDLQTYERASKRPEMGKIYLSYTQRCFQNGAMDFDDILLKTNELLRRFPETLARYQQRFKYILVDEYQDTNHLQYSIVKALAARNENLCVVGDDAQSIYAFRGANIQNILNFKKDYPDAKIFRLEQNYRSTKYIVQAANSIIANNKGQIEKAVWTQNPMGDKITIFQAQSDLDEAAFVAQAIDQIKEKNELANRSFAVLYRTNAQSRAIEEALRRKGLSYRIYGGLSFYQRKEIKDLLAYLRLAVNPSDDEALLRIINYPARGIGQTTLNKIVVAAAQQNENLLETLTSIKENPTLEISKGTQTKLIDFYTLIESYRTYLDKDAFKLAEYITRTSGILQALKEDNSPEGMSRLENIQELLNSIKNFVEESYETGQEPSLARFLEDAILDSDAQDPLEENKISLMTVHLAKGLEFPIVFIVGLEDNLFPSLLSLNTRQELEEERRLFYVALTRAQKRAFLSHAQVRYRWGQMQQSEPSRFLDEIDAQVVEKIGCAPTPNRNRFGKIKKNHQTKEASAKDFVSKRNPTENGYRTTLLNKRLTPIKKAESSKGNNLNISENDRVLHERFGAGIVISIENSGADAKAKIRFDGVGEKTLLLNFARLTKINQN